MVDLQNGAGAGLAVWVRENGVDRPLVKAGAFPANPVKWFLTPALSPGGGRVIYVRSGLNGKRSLAVAKTSGEAAAAILVPDGTALLPQWSPDGQWIKYLDLKRIAWVLVSPGWERGAGVVPIRW